MVHKLETNTDEIDLDDLRNKLAQQQKTLLERRAELDLLDEKLVRHGAMLDCLRGVESETDMLRSSRPGEEIPYFGVGRVYAVRKMDR